MLLQYKLWGGIQQHTFRRSGWVGVLSLAYIWRHRAYHRVRFINGEMLLIFLAWRDLGSFLSHHSPNEATSLHWRLAGVALWETYFLLGLVEKRVYFKLLLVVSSNELQVLLWRHVHWLAGQILTTAPLVYLLTEHFLGALLAGGDWRNRVVGVLAAGTWRATLRLDQNSIRRIWSDQTRTASASAEGGEHTLALLLIAH